MKKSFWVLTIVLGMVLTSCVKEGIETTGCPTQVTVYYHNAEAGDKFVGVVYYAGEYESLVAPLESGRVAFIEFKHYPGRDSEIPVFNTSPQLIELDDWGINEQKAYRFNDGRSMFFDRHFGDKKYRFNFHLDKPE